MFVAFAFAKTTVMVVKLIIRVSSFASLTGSSASTSTDTCSPLRVSLSCARSFDSSPMRISISRSWADWKPLAGLSLSRKAR